MNTETESITHSYFSPKWHFKYLWKSHFLFFIVTTCPQKCNFRTSDLYAFGDPLGKIDLTIEDKKKIFNFCLGFSFNKININCSSWKVTYSISGFFQLYPISALFTTISESRKINQRKFESKCCSFNRVFSFLIK